jgi:hyperosmotically inducible periplasmic protein
MGAKSFLVGAAAGAAAVWFLDPDTGGRRRSVAQDKAMKYARKGAAEAESKASYAAGQAAATVERATPSDKPPAEERLNDPALARKVESEIFRAEDAPKGAVSVNVEDGVVFLRGEVADDETIRQLAEGAAQVEGVRGVENLLRSGATTN